MSVSLPVTPIPTTQRVHHQEVARSTANYPPNIWGDRFLTYAPDDTVTQECKAQKIKELKEEVRKELKASAHKSPELLKLIDSIQLLGLTYHFEREIEEALKDMYGTYSLVDDNEDLTNASLRFRLLRQEGYGVPSDVFSKFKDKEGNFKESLIGDLPGMLALYEATHLMVHGEDILEEALAFTTAHLQSVATDPNNPLSKQVIRALKLSIHNGVTSVGARHYISIYQEDGSHNESLLKLAKLDFNLLQSLHRKELSEITRWWKVRLCHEATFARDRLVEIYFSALGVCFEPQYSLSLRFLTKVAIMITMVDDIYDAYGTIEELTLLTEAIERWDASSIDQLPDYMKCFYRALLDLYEEMEQEMAKEGKLYRVHYAKELMKKQIQSYFVEAKWSNQGYIPTFDEYMSNGVVSGCCSLLIATSFVGMGDIVTKESFQWVLSRPTMIGASQIICRLMDDMASHEFEQKRVHVASSVECYMKQYGVSKQEAYDELNKQVVKAWKDINQECLKPTPVLMPIITRVLNIARMMNILYKDGDEFTHVGKQRKDLIASILIDPVPM
ncbi:(-)-germacrene D synthase-like [Vitis vinifera]|uniref:(E,E)-alpha-farnesene synthase n=1 Tax=Vitis vinifera TaxID=29760 RepID=E5GAF9_VITVI|nr:(-)-germacrene D synthase-like [Vitis vinifera]ADR74198.1 (E,E)-alpha-farnesene synthase [Vitis vinifera]|eukprot:NP_001268015.1 (-)-germacrene D synthase-like [Vitis vinifera]